MSSEPGDPHGGEAPCLAPLLDASSIDDAALGRLVRDLADGVIIADVEGAIVFWNTAATRLFGWASDEAIGQTLDLIIPERQRARHWDGYRRVMATGHTDYGERLLEVPALHRDGRRLSVAFTVSLVRAVGMSLPIGIAAVLRDDTERWQERRALREEAARLSRGGKG